MKGFGIYVKNNLLEAKHIEAMGESVWLYMWLLDKMTSVNESGIGRVLGGQPVTFTLIEIELGLSTRTYRRWVDKLRDAGYIRTLRTPYGLVITVNKAEKIFSSSKRSATSGTSKKLKTNRDVPKTAQPDVPHLSKDVPHLSKDVPKVAHVIKTIQDNTIDNSTNVLEPPARYGKEEINELFDYWSSQCGFDIETRVANNRRAASNLYKKYGTEKMHRLIEGVSMAQSDQYAPTIGDFCELQQKLPSLLVWGKKKHGASAVDVIS
jgi:hypothetical protein